MRLFVASLACAFVIATGCASAAPVRGETLSVQAGRDTRELLRRGWRVLATDMTPEGLETLWRLTPPQDRGRLETEISRLQDFEIPACDLLNANLILPFQPADDYAATWARVLAAIPVGGRFSGMLFGDRDDLAAVLKYVNALFGGARQFRRWMGDYTR